MVPKGQLMSVSLSVSLLAIVLAIGLYMARKKGYL